MERVAKAESIQKSTIEEICTLEKDCGVKITEEIVNSWRLMEKTALTKSLHGKGYDDGSEEKWREHYVEKLLLLEEARSAVNDCTTVQLVKQVQEQIKQLERDIKAVESSKEIAIRWRKHTDQFRKAHTRLEDKRKVGFLTRARSHALERIFHLALKRKYSDGQAIPNRLEKMIKKATKRLNGIVETYNESEFFSKSNIANKISFMDVKDPEGQIYHILDAGIEAPDQVPASMRHRAISLLSLRDRAQEEKMQVFCDANQFINNCHKKLDQYLQCVEEFTERTKLGIDTCYSKGALTLLWKAVNDLQKRVDASRSFDFSSTFGLAELNENREMVDTLTDDTETAYIEQLADLDLEDYDDVFDMDANDVFYDT